jgi:hypothetical protein
MASPADVIREELEYRARTLAQEAWSFARAARRSVITASDVALAARGAACAALASADAPTPWSQHAESAAARLILSEGVVRSQTVPPSALLSGGGGAGATRGIGSRSAAAALAAVVANLHAAAMGDQANGQDAEEGGAALLALRASLRALESGEERRVLPAIVTELRSVLERAILDDSLPGGSSRALRVLRVTHMLIDDATMPIEVCAGEFLALAASAVLSAGGSARLRWGEGAAEADRGDIADAPADMALLRTREFAARVLFALTSRLALSYPDVTDQVAGVLIDAIATACRTGPAAGNAGGLEVYEPATVIGAAAAIKRLAPSAAVIDVAGRLLARLLVRWADEMPKAGSWGEICRLEVTSAATRLSRLAPTALL